MRFYFDSKDAMLLASLGYLAAEFEERVLVPVGRLKDSPARALELLVDLYLDPEIASTRKVSVWYSFWGEASSRQEYLDICGKKDEDFAVLVRQLMERLIAETGARHLDADGVALGLIGVLEVLWQGFAFQSEESIDRAAARERSLAYLRSVFPGSFAAGRAPVADARLPAWAYCERASARARARASAATRAGRWWATHGLDANRQAGPTWCTISADTRGHGSRQPTSLEIERTGPLLLARPRQSAGEARSAAAAGWPTEWPDLRPGRVRSCRRGELEDRGRAMARERYAATPFSGAESTARPHRGKRAAPAGGAGGAGPLPPRVLRAAAGSGGRSRSAARQPAAQPADRAGGVDPAESRGGAPAGEGSAAVPAALAEFRRSVATLLPLLAQTRWARR